MSDENFSTNFETWCFCMYQTVFPCVDFLKDFHWSDYLQQFDWFSSSVKQLVYSKARFIKSENSFDIKVLYFQDTLTRRLNLPSILEMVLPMLLGNHLMTVVLIKILRSGTENPISQITNGNRLLQLKTQSVARSLYQPNPTSITSVWGHETIKVTVDLHMLLKLDEEVTRRQMVLFWNKFQVRLYEYVLYERMTWILL